MYGQLVVNAWVGINEGCEITCNVEGSDEVHIKVSGQAQPFEFHFQADAFERFLDLGGKALAEMNALAEQEEAECADQGQPAANPGV